MPPHVQADLRFPNQIFDDRLAGFALRQVLGERGSPCLPMGEPPAWFGFRSNHCDLSRPDSGVHANQTFCGFVTERHPHFLMHIEKSLVNSRLAANSQAPKLPETHSRDEAEKRGALIQVIVRQASARSRGSVNGNAGF